MAEIIPSRIPSKATQGEKRLHGLLARLPDDCVVYFEPNVNGRHPDFVVLSPTLGILVIEDKHWWPGTILKGDSHFVTILDDDQQKCVSHPLRQVREYSERIRDIAAKCRFGHIFLHQDGRHLGRLKFPVGHVVTLSNITSRELNNPERPLGSLFLKEQTITRDVLESWEALSPDELLDQLQRFFTVRWSFPPLNPDQMNALRALIHPEIDFDQRFSIDDLDREPRAIHDRQDVLKVLDLRQEDNAGAIGEGHRILYGVAGSGKTIILITRARLVAQASPDKRILLVCYNKHLSSWLTERLSDLPNVTVSTFHGMCGRNGAPFRKVESDQETGERLLSHLQGGSIDARAYDAVLVDEAQDFEPVWFSCLLAMMKDPENGDLLIVADGAQGIYRRSKIAWSHLGIRARGRTSSVRYDLDQNYRNSTEILTLAETFASRTGADEDGDDGIQAARVDPRRCMRSTGASPVLFFEPGREKELRRAVFVVRQLLQGTWNGRAIGPLTPGEIAILYPSAFDEEKARLSKLSDTLFTELGIDAEWLGGESRRSNNDSPLKIQTIHSSKGLQYRAVIILWADKLPRKNYQATETAESESLDRRLLYVGMTRAESFLALIASRRSRFLDEIASSPAADVIDSTKGIHSAEPATPDWPRRIA
jgi:hypothetical protein